MRHEPDQFLDEHLHTTMQPEAATGVWFADGEIMRFRSALRFQLEHAGLGDAASELTADIDPDETSTENLVCALRFPLEMDVGGVSHAPEALLRLGTSHHPDLGVGFERLLVTPVHVPGEGEPGGQGPDSFAGLVFVNTLNTFDVASPSTPLGIAPWSLWQGQICNALFIDGESTRTLQTLATVSVGDVLAVLGLETSLPALSYLASVVSSGEVEGLTIDEQIGWEGIEQNAGVHAVLFDSDVVVPPIVARLPRNELIEPIDVTRELWGIPHSRPAAVFGVFNPAGPSVGSIEVAVDYRHQLAFVLERLRHPFSPTLKLHAVLDRDGFDRRPDLVRSIVGGLGWSLLDWCAVLDRDPDVADAVYQGLGDFAVRQRIDVAAAADALVAHVDSPWERLSAGKPGEAVGPQSAENVERWVEIVTHPRNVDTHVAHLRSAWEGALALDRGPDQAQHVADRLAAEIADRRAAR